MRTGEPVAGVSTWEFEHQARRPVGADGCRLGTPTPEAPVTVLLSLLALAHGLPQTGEGAWIPVWLCVRTLQTFTLGCSQ